MRIKRVFLLLSLLPVILVILFAGPLLTLNPLRTGYRPVPFSGPRGERQGTVYIDRKITENLAVPDPAPGMKALEDFHRLAFSRKLQIYICRDRKEMRRIFPFFRTDGSGFAWAGSLICINYERARENGYALEPLIKHEAAHSLLYQNLGGIRDRLAMATGVNRWFREGLAVFNQGFYTMTERQLEQALEDNRIRYEAKKTSFAVEPKNFRTDYNLYGRFIEYLERTYGREPLENLIALMVRDFTDGGNHFFRVYGRSLQEELALFRDKVSFTQDS